MLYVGHFSFADPDSGPNDVPWHGLFTLVAEGKSVDVAVRKFERQIRDLARRHGLFDGVSEIYLDTCVELRTVPRAGVLTYVTIREGDDVGGISASLLGANARVGASYGWGSQQDVEATDPRPMEPFVRFRRRKAAKTKKSPAARMPARSKGSTRVH
jgi:hypothetical protein